MQSASDGSSRSAKCFLPNTALPGADGHLLRVQHLEPGQQVRLADGAEASVVHVKKHMASRKGGRDFGSNSQAMVVLNGKPMGGCY